jgi:LemA protein
MRGTAVLAAISLLRVAAKAGTLLDMGTALIILLVSVVGAGLLALFAIGQYNSLITLRNRYKNSFSQIDVQLKRHHDLILDLVETTKGCLKHERETLETVTSARNSAYSAGAKAAANPGNPRAIKELMAAEARLSVALEQLFAVAEAYPDLKADQNMLQLSDELTSTKKKISSARRTYNDAVMAYNTRREVFPSNMIAGMFSLAAAELLEFEDAAEKSMPKVSFT